VWVVDVVNGVDVIVMLQVVVERRVRGVVVVIHVVVVVLQIKK
jgi:hypothetical protein